MITFDSRAHAAYSRKAFLHHGASLARVEHQGEIPAIVRAMLFVFVCVLVVAL